MQDNSLGSMGAFEPANASDAEENDNAQEEAYLQTIDPDNPFDGTPLGGVLPGGPLAPIQQPNDPATLHGQAYGAAIDNQGRADCENGQRGYPHGPLATSAAGQDQPQRATPTWWSPTPTPRATRARRSRAATRVPDGPDLLSPAREPGRRAHS